MSGEDPTRDAMKTSAGVLGMGAAACVACCAGPILGALSAIGVATAAGYAVAGAVALVVGGAAVGWVLYRRRRRQRACAPERVSSIASPTVRPPQHPPAGAPESGRPDHPAREPTPG